METSQAKSIPIARVLALLGHQPVKSFKAGTELAYRSPLRPGERTASFFVNVPKNCWNDFGVGEGGDLPYLLMKIRGTDFLGALAFLETLINSIDFDSQPFSPLVLANDKDAASSFSITQIKPFGETLGIRRYITETRRVAPAVATRFLKEIHFRADGNSKQWYAAGFVNLSGGHELRNPYFKGCIGSKDLSFVRGTGSGGVGEGSLHIFEGFMDFLTCLTAFQRDAPGTDVLVLNTTAHAAKAVEFIREKNYKNLRPWLHNDAAGKAALQSLIEQTECLIEPQNHRYLGFKDLNECFLETGKIF